MPDEDLPPSYATSQSSCSTCAQLLHPTSESKSPASESKSPPLQNSCCGRWVCSHCIETNPRFATYCPFCPASTRILPPSYTPASSSSSYTPASSSSSSSSALPPTYTPAPVPDITHFLTPTDTLAGLSLQYNVPLASLRAHNHLFVDTHLAARATLQIPRTHYQGPSLSPAPLPDDSRKCIVKRFQVATKCVDTRMAEVYVEAAGGSLEDAMDAWRSDEVWVREQEERERRGREIVSAKRRGRKRA